MLFLDVEDESVRMGTTILYWSLGEPKRYTSPSPYREYSSYSVEGKVLFLRRKKRLHVVVFRIYARGLKDQAHKSQYPRT